MVLNVHAESAPKPADAPDVVTLERGTISDPEFELWASQLWDYRAAADPPRRDLRVELLNAAGQAVLSDRLSACLPCDFVALPTNAPTGESVIFETLILQHQGLTRENSPA